MTKKKVYTANDAWDARKSYNRHPMEIEHPNVVISSTNPVDTSTAPTPQQDTQSTVNLPVTSNEDKELIASLTKARNDNLTYINTLKDEIVGLKAEKQVKIPKSEADLEDFAKKHPDLFSIFTSYVERRLIKADIDFKKRTDEIEAKQRQLDAKEAFAEILKIHPDAKAIRDDAKFSEWVSKQTKGVKGLFASDSIEDAIYLIDLYKTAMGIKTPQPKQTQRDALKTPSGSGNLNMDISEKPIFKESDVARMSDKQFAKLEKQIDLARAEGRFVYDVARKYY